MSDHKVLSALLRPFFRKGAEAGFSLPGALRDDARLLCIDAGQLCDVLFHVPLLTAIRRRFPGSTMDFLMPEKHAPLVVPSGLARQCLLYKPGQLNPWRPSFASLLRQVQAGGYDLAVLMAHEPQPSLEMVALASGAALRYGPSHPGAWPAINFELRSDPDGYLGDRLRHAAPLLGIAPGELKTRWPLPLDKLRQMAQQVHFHKPNPQQLLVGIDPGPPLVGAAVPLETWQAVARALSGHLQCRVLALSHPDHAEAVARFEVLLANPAAGLGRETLLEVVLLLSHCDLFLAANADTFHFAIAAGVPTVGLFAPEVPACWRPRGRPGVVLIEPGEGGRCEPERLLAAVDEALAGRRREAAATPPPSGTRIPDVTGA